MEVERLTREFLSKVRQKRLEIHCLGDGMVDEYYSVQVNRISPEFPMPIMTATNSEPVYRPGGVANVAHQMKRFNVQVALHTFPDENADAAWHQCGVWRSYWHEPLFHAHLPIKRRFLDNGIQVTRWDIEQPRCGYTDEQIEEYMSAFCSYLETNQRQPDVAIFSDYDKGFFSSSKRIIDGYKDTITIVDPKSENLWQWNNCTIFKPNAKEAFLLSGYMEWKDQCKYFQDHLTCPSVVITCGGSRVVGISGNEFFCYQPDRRVAVESVVGAGDCFAAFLAMAVGHGFSVHEASQIAFDAGATYVQNKMNRPICPAELSRVGIVDPEDLMNRDFKLVFTNGCFDILHEGHLKTLEYAKSKGERLVVAINSDASVKRLKGESRPVKPLAQRMAVMAGLKMVDYVVSFEEDTPYEVIQKICPDVLVKGSDYQMDTIIGADIVPEVFRAPILEGLSTTRLLNRDV